MEILTTDERDLMTHISRWGSDGYPIRKLKRGWIWEYRGIKGPPLIFKTKRESIQSFEAFHRTLLERLGAIAKARAEAAQ